MVGISMASLPGSTVWQKATLALMALRAPIEPVPGTQYGLLGKGVLMEPSRLHLRPPFIEAGYE